MDPADAVLEEQAGARVAIRGGEFGEETLGRPGDPLVDVDLDHGFDVRVPQDLAQGTAVATADDAYPSGGGMSEEGRVGHHLVVEKVVPAGQHDEAVDHHEITESLGGIDLDQLVRGLLLMELFGHLE